MPIARKTTAAEAIATYLSWDIDEMVEHVYQPTLLFNPSVFTDGEDYYCCPAKGRKPPVTDRDGDDRGFVWKPVFEFHGRTVFESKMADMNAKEEQ